MPPDNLDVYQQQPLRLLPITAAIRLRMQLCCSESVTTPQFCCRCFLHQRRLHRQKKVSSRLFPYHLLRCGISGSLMSHHLPAYLHHPIAVDRLSGMHHFCYKFSIVWRGQCIVYSSYERTPLDPGWDVEPLQQSAKEASGSSWHPDLTRGVRLHPCWFLGSRCAGSRDATSPYASAMGLDARVCMCGQW